MENSAAHDLMNRTLKNDWVVKQKLEKGDNQTGAFFSVCYLVERQGETCFLKAYDIMKFNLISTPDTSMMGVMNDMTTAYKYEQELSDYCREKHVTKVSFVKEAGEEIVSGHSFSVVPYLIFDLADGDVRKHLEFSKELDYAWRFKSLHDVAIGLKQLHQIEVSHQDLKPSNILVFSAESKLGDLGRSMCKSLDGPYNNKHYSGDFTYAPPEILYGYYEKDWQTRVFATDCYLLGSLVVFYFAGISMSALLRKHLPENFSWERWTGSYSELIPYLDNAYTSALDEFELNINRSEYKEKLRQLVEYLCQPHPEKRGHPENIARRGSNYSMERFISTFNLLKRKSELNMSRI